MSIVLATNRPGAFLAEALTSVQDQTHRPIEVIVVDDGSSDEGAVLAMAGRIREAKVIRIARSGVAVARNVGAAETSGKYLLFLDDDDRWAPDRVSQQVAAMEAHADAAASYCGLQVVGAVGELLSPADQSPVSDRLEIARGSGGILLPNLMIRRDDFFAVGGFHAVLTLAEDLDLVLRLAERGRFVFVDRALVEYRMHDDNSTKRIRELVGSIERILRLHRAEATERGDRELAAALSERLRRNERYAWWGAIRDARQFLHRRDYAGAASAVGWALRFHPAGIASAFMKRMSRRPSPSASGR